MAEETKKIEWRKEATFSIASIADYISENGFPETSTQYANRMYTFGESLLLFPDKYPICRFQKLAKRNLRCAVFENTYIFAYKVVKGRLVIYNVIHSKALK